MTSHPTRTRGPAAISTRVATPAPHRDLEALFDPRSVAILGASNDTAKWGHTLTKQMLGSGSDAAVHLVNHHGASVLGRRTVRTLAEARDANGAPLDLVAICIPAAGFLGAVDAALEVGARAIISVAAGFSESGVDGARIEAEARDRVRQHGAVMVGPNCLGIVDTTSNLQLSSERFPAGSIAVLSQSGNLVIDLADLMHEHGLGVSRFVSLGNQSDLGVVDFMTACLEHRGTTAVAIYAEDVVDGRAFIRAARALHAAGKPVVLLAPGRSEASMRGAVSHTGSLTSAARVVDAACAASGIHRVDTPQQMVDLLAAFRSPRRTPGSRVAVVTDGGGHGAVAADAVVAAGLQVPALGSHLRRRLSGALWVNSAVANPVDLAGAGEQDAMSYARAVAGLLGSDEVDAVLLTGYFGGYSLETSSLHDPEIAAAREIARATVEQAKPVVVQTIYPDSPSCQVLREAGIPVHRDIGRGSGVLAGLLRGRAHAFLDPIDLPASSAPLIDTDYGSARRLFAGVGVVFPAAEQVRDEQQLHDAVTSGAIEFPVVLKALGQSHKSDAGGVVLGLDDVDATLDAYRDLVRRLQPPAVSVEEMADLASGVELIIGTAVDPKFGPVLMLGLGGIFTEVLGDLAFAIAPVTPGTAREMFFSLRGADLLKGLRGRAPVDVDAAAQVAARVSMVAAEHPELGELEINPVLCLPSGALALDARVVPLDRGDAWEHGNRAQPPDLSKGKGLEHFLE